MCYSICVRESPTVAAIESTLEKTSNNQIDFREDDKTNKQAEWKQMHDRGLYYIMYSLFVRLVNGLWME